MTTRDGADHPDEELLAAFAADAVGEAERAPIEAHLVACARCRRLLDDYRETVHSLADLLQTESPPLRVRAAVMDRVNAETARRSSKRWVPLGAGIAASLLVGVALGLGLGLLQLRSDMAATEAAVGHLEEMLRQERLVAYLAASPETEVLVLATAQEGSRAYGMLMGPREARFVVLVVGGLEDPGPGRAYQIWFTVDGQRHSGGTFTVDASGWAQVQARPPMPMAQVTRIGITREPAAGSAEPTSEPLLAWARR